MIYHGYLIYTNSEPLYPHAWGFKESIPLLHEELLEDLRYLAVEGEAKVILAIKMGRVEAETPQHAMQCMVEGRFIGPRAAVFDPAEITTDEGIKKSKDRYFESLQIENFPKGK